MTAAPQPQRSTPGARFRGADEAADVAVVVVTYRNADHLDPLVATLRREAVDLAIRLVIVDNDSDDGSHERALSHSDVIAIDARGNLGYAGGINLAMRHVGETEAVLVLNPDLTVGPGAIGLLLQRMRDSRAGAVVPLMTDPAGITTRSLRREPSVLRALGDALAGSRWASRPAWLSEEVRDLSAYERPHPAEWATGAAILVRASTARAVGDWDESFFLYSEETDFLRRIRELGQEVWFEPSAVVRHERGGSGRSPRLVALEIVNKYRYVRARSGGAYSGLFRVVLTAHELRRYRDPEHRDARTILLRPAAWAQLPAAAARRRSGTDVRGAVVIPAHDESSVIARTLTPLAELARNGLVDVVVACNGCQDDTAERARAFAGVVVIEIEAPSKVAALNAADALPLAWPRLYLDADIEIEPGAVLATLDALAALDEPAAARPPFRYETRGASWPVRSYYRARSRVPYLVTAMWGAGVYGMNRAGHERLGGFPDRTADDLHVDLGFDPREKRIVSASPVVVRTPRTVSALLAIMRRGRRGSAQAGVDTGGRTSRELLATVRGPRSALDAAVFALLSVAGRRGADRSPVRWERDDTSRA